MRTYSIKLFNLIASSAFLVAPSLLKGDDSSGSTLQNEERLSSLEKDYQMQSRICPKVNGAYDFFLTGEYLYWRTSSYSLEPSILDSAPSTFVLNDYIQNLPFKATSGVRVGLGLRIPRDFWAFSTTWTWLSTSIHRFSSGNPTFELVYPEWSTNLAPTTATTVAGSWKVYFNILDGEVSRYLPITKSLSCIPHMGIRGLWINQKYISTTLNAQTALANAVSSDVIVFKNHFSGVGLVMGMKSEWKVRSHLSFVTNIGGSLLYGSYHITGSDTLISHGIVNLLTNKDYTHQVAPTANLSLGLAYDSSFFCDKIAARLQIGWELNDFFGQNKFKHYLAGEDSNISFISNNEDITTQGLVVSGRIDY